jgi:hypothetical protein
VIGLHPAKVLVFMQHFGRAGIIVAGVAQLTLWRQLGGS